MERISGLHRLSDTELTGILRALARGHLDSPVTRRGLVLAKLGHLEEHLDALVGHETKAASAIVAALLHERKHRAPVQASLLWSGPRPSGTGAREPYDALQELIATTEHELLWMGADLQRDERLLRSLHAAVRGRDLRTTLVLGTPESAELVAAAHALFQERRPWPEIYAPVAEQLHAPLPRCLVFDAMTTVLLTGSVVAVEPDERTACAGALVREPALAQTLALQLRVLIEAGAISPLTAA